MEKLTDFELEQIDNQLINDGTNTQIRKLVDEVKEYRQLKKEIGCPLAIKCRIRTGDFIYLPNGKPYLIVGVRDSYFRIKIEDGCTETVDNSEYGISWWLKADRSE